MTDMFDKAMQDYDVALAALRTANARAAEEAPTLYPYLEDKARKFIADDACAPIIKEAARKVVSEARLFPTLETSLTTAAAMVALRTQQRAFDDFNDTLATLFASPGGRADTAAFTSLLTARLRAAETVFAGAAALIELHIATIKTQAGLQTKTPGAILQDIRKQLGKDGGEWLKDALGELANSAVPGASALLKLIKIAKELRERIERDPLDYTTAGPESAIANLADALTAQNAMIQLCIDGLYAECAV